MEKKHIPVTLTQEEINNIVSSMPITMNMLAGNEEEAEKYRHVELDNEELKKLITSGSMPISYNYLAGNTEKAEEAKSEYKFGKSEPDSIESGPDI